MYYLCSVLLIIYPKFKPGSLGNKLWDVACTSKFDCNGWASNLILSNVHVVFHKVSLFSGDRYFIEHFIILGSQKATFKKVELGALHIVIFKSPFHKSMILQVLFLQAALF